MTNVESALVGAALFLSLLLLPGCALTPHAPQLLVPAYRPQNVFLWSASLPPHIRRVALLPVICERDTAEMAAGREALEPILQWELEKTHRFEITLISPEMLRARTGQPAWSCEEVLPPDLLPWLSESCGCDAVLFCRLTEFRGYAPLAVGWRMRLVDVRSRATLWATDEVFDAGQPAVRAGARRYQLAGRQNCGPAPEEWLIENSPSRFGQYAAAQLVATLPGL